MGSDRTSAGWVLMTMAIAAGWWYWNLLPEQKRALRSPSPLKADLATGGVGGLQTAPITGTPAYNPAIGKDGLTDAERARMRRQRRGAVPFDAGGRLAGLFGES
jgi:hypothetical protein